MLCTKCAANLPEGSQFCLKCGQPVRMPAVSEAALTVTATLACSKCGASLPDGAQFCLKCGKPVSFPAKAAADTGRSAAVDPPRAGTLRATSKPRIIPWILLAVLFVVTIWAASSDNPAAQAVQEAVGWKHDQTILDSPFTVGPHTFRYYKFALPEGSVNVSVVGQFIAASDSSGKPAGQSKDQDKESDSTVEVYVLSEPAFTVWQNGYATSSIYESGRVGGGAISADLPAGAGIYYLIFSNKFAPKTAKSIKATAFLRYKSWLPEWLRRIKNSF